MFYCVLDEAGEIILAQKVAMTPEAMKASIDLPEISDEKTFARDERHKVGTNIFVGPRTASASWLPQELFANDRTTRRQNGIVDILVDNTALALAQDAFSGSIER